MTNERWMLEEHFGERYRHILHRVSVKQVSKEMQRKWREYLKYPVSVRQTIPLVSNLRIHQRT